MQKRFESKYLWMAIFALVGFVLKQWGLFEVLGLDINSFNEMIDLILAVLIGIGVINNPTSKEEW